MPRAPLSRRKGSRLAWAPPHAHGASGVLIMSSLVLLGPLACASNAPRQQLALASTRDMLASLDEFGTLLVQAGLCVESLPRGSEVSPQQAGQLRLHFLLCPARPMEYAPRLVADVLLRDVEARREPISRLELGRRIQDFQFLRTLRPDGYLASALTGRAEQCVGPVEVQDGALRAGAFDLGSFYKRNEKDEWQRVDVPGTPVTSF
jgi:hypothetical protein